MADRNQQARERFADESRRKQLIKAHQQFREAFTLGRVQITDRFGRVVQPNSKVIWFPPPHGMVYEVVDVSPVMDLSSPPGLLRVTVSMSVSINYRGGQMAVDMLVVGDPPVATGDGDTEKSPADDAVNGEDTALDTPADDPLAGDPNDSDA